MKETNQNIEGSSGSLPISGYGYVDNGTLISAYSEGSIARDFHVGAHEYFREYVQGSDFPCIAGKSAIRSENYAFCSYPDMENPDGALSLVSDLGRYMHEFPFGVPFNTFVAAFERPDIDSQMRGVEAFYTLLANLHAMDTPASSNASVADTAVDAPDFGFSLAGERFFVPFFYPHASSATRRSDINFVVMNGHKVFTFLRESGAFEKLKARIRDRMGTPHPNLADLGEGNQFIQYALVDPHPEAQVQEREIRERVLGSCPFSNS